MWILVSNGQNCVTMAQVTKYIHNSGVGQAKIWDEDVRPDTWSLLNISSVSACSCTCMSGLGVCLSSRCYFLFFFFLFSHDNKQVLMHSTVAMKQSWGESGSRLRGISFGSTGWERCPSMVKLNSSLSLSRKKTSYNSPHPSSRLLSSHLQAIKAALCGNILFKEINAVWRQHSIIHLLP